MNMDLYICTEREFYFSKKKERKKNQKGVLITTLHTVWPETFYWSGSAFILSKNFGRGQERSLEFKENFFGT